MATEIKSTSIKSQNIIAEPQVNKPGSPEAGQIIQSTGTGDIAKGIYHYSGASWFSLDNAQGDLETLRLVLSTDTTAVGFSSALNSTSTLAGNTNAIPHETSTGTGMLGALEIPSTGGDALLTEFDANKVFRYYSAGANNNNDYFGIPIDIPAQTRGQNIVIKFKYRTEEASDTTSNGDFQVSVWDKSNGVKTTSTNTSTVAAGAAITVASSTGMAVGDKIWLESGGNAVNNVANSITQGYITEVTSGTSIKISSDWTPASTAGSLVVTGWLSDQVSGLLSEADSDTNKVGKDFSIAVKTEETTDQVVLWISNKSTTTNVIELFFDGILVSQNKFLQASSQFKPQSGQWYGRGGTNGFGSSYNAVLLPQNEQYNSIDNTFGTLDWDSSTNGFSFTATKECKIEMNVSAARSTAGGFWIGISRNATGTELTSHPTSLAAGKCVALGYGDDGTGNVNSSFVGILQPGDVIRPQSSLDVIADHSNDYEMIITLSVQNTQSDVILLESQDEIFTDTVEYTPTWTGLGTVSENKATWSRIGDKMYIMGNVKSGTTSGTTISFTLPSGYNIDGSKLGIESNTSVTGQNVGHAGQQNGAGRSFLVLANTVTATDKLYFGGASTGSTIGIPSNSMGNTENLTFRAMIPIQGWNTNFNPLLSMPLVEIGTDYGYFNGYLAAGVGPGSSYRKYIDTTYIDTLSTSTLGTLTKGSSTAAFNFQASANCIVTVNWTFGASTTYQMGPVFGASTNVTDSTKAQNSSDLDGLRAGVVEQNGSTGQGQNSARFPLKAGENFQMAQSTTNSAHAGGINSLFSIMVERDRSNTNMAHIIKPAVAIISDEHAAYGTWGGDLGAINTWQTRALNTVRGESWFVSLNDSTDVFTLDPGTYKITGQAPLLASNAHKIRLYDNTNGVAIVNGANAFSASGSNVQTAAHIQGSFTITASTDFIIQHIFNLNYSGAAQGGYDSGGTNSGPSVFTTIMIEKLK